MNGAESFQIHHAFLVLELEDGNRVTAEVTGTSITDIFFSFSPGGEMTSSIFDPKSDSLKLQDVIHYCPGWAKKGYNFLSRNCYHFVYDILDEFGSGDKEVVLGELQRQKAQGISTLTSPQFLARQYIEALMTLANPQSYINALTAIYEIEMQRK